MKKVLITGIGMVTAVGNGKTATWEAVKAGKPGVSRITKFDPSRCTSQVAAEVKGFDEYALGAGLIDKKAMRHMALFSQYAVASANEAWKDCLQLMEDEGWSWTLWTGKNMQGNGNWGLWNYRAHSPDVDALASDDYETVKVKWAALSAPGAFVENTAITSVIRQIVNAFAE